MKTKISVYLDTDLEKQLCRLAKELHTTKSGVIRKALHYYTYWYPIPPEMIETLKNNSLFEE